MRVLGLTGGIGCGKSTVAALLEARGVPVVDADQLGREVVAPGSGALRELVAAFGAGILRADGTLDRKGLAAVVFNDRGALRHLDAITHPRIAALATERLRALRDAGHTLAALEAALLLEAGWDRVTDAVVVVTTTPELQLARLLARGDVTEADARSRIASQMPLATKEARADHLIRNDGSLADLEARVDELLRSMSLEEPPR